LIKRLGLGKVARPSARVAHDQMWQILKTDCSPAVYVSALQQAKMAKLFLRKMEMGRKKLQVDKMRMDMQKRSVPSPHSSNQHLAIFRHHHNGAQSHFAAPSTGLDADVGCYMWCASVGRSCSSVRSCVGCTTTRSDSAPPR
jgi:hypothetical protein